MDPSKRLVEVSSGGPVFIMLESISVLYDAGIGVLGGMLLMSKLELDRVEIVLTPRLVSSTVELELGVMKPEISDTITDAVIAFVFELGWVGVEKLSVTPDDAVKNSEDDAIIPEGVVVASTAVGSDLSYPAVRSVLSSALVEVVAGPVLVDASVVDMVLDSHPALPAGFETRDDVSTVCIIDGPVAAAGDVVPDPDTSL